MKFAAALIKIFSGMLSAVVFGAFLYYTYQYQTTKDTEYLFTANMALIVFLISSVCFALLFVLFDVYQSKNTESDLVKLLKSSDLNNNSEKTNITDLLVKIASFGNMTNQLLDGHFKELNNGLNTLNNSSEINSTNFQATLEQLTNICGEISQYVDNIKTENAKENQRAAGHSGNFDVLVATVSRLSSDLNNLNGRLLDVVNQISKNVTASIQSHTDIDNEIKDLLQKILLSKSPENTNTAVLTAQPQDDVKPLAESNSEDAENSDEPAPQSLADFYEEHFKDIQENNEEKAEDAPIEVSEDTNVLNENENRIDELLTTPVTDEVITPQSLDLTESQTENLVEDIVADDATYKESQEPWEQPMAEEISEAEQEYEPQADNKDLPTETTDDTNISTVSAEEPASLVHAAEQTADVDIYSSLQDTAAPSESFEQPADVETPATSVDFENAAPADEQSEPTPPAETATYDKPANEPYFEQTPVKTSVNDFSLEAADPFNPSPEHYADISLSAPTGDNEPISLDLPNDEEPISLDLPSEESNVKLDDIFNDKFASDMADLDILKDDKPAENSGEISVEDLLADDKDPYNPNK